MLFVVGVVLFEIVVYGGLLWGSIYLLDRQNIYNTFAQALAVAVVRVVVILVAGWLGIIFGLVALVAWFVLILRILLNHYDLGVVRTIGVLVLIAAVPYVVAPQLRDALGEDEIGTLLFLYGVPATILGTWYWARRNYTVLGQRKDKLIPQARVVTEPKPVAPAEPVAPTAPTTP